VYIIFIALVFISLVSAGSESGQPGNSADALAPDIRTPQIRYIANSGMLVIMAGRRFLIDAPIQDGIAPYATSPADERARLEGSRPHTTASTPFS
jgi:hypothetical protein